MFREFGGGSVEGAELGGGVGRHGVWWAVVDG